MRRLTALAALMTLVSSTQASYIVYCSLADEPVIQIGKDPVTEKFVVIHQTSIDESSAGRGLETLPRGISLDSSAFIDAIEVDALRLLEEADYEGDLIEVRKCSCSDRHAYCPIDKEYCGVPKRSQAHQLPGCVNQNMQRNFVRSIWIYLFVWISILILIFLCTPCGQNMLISLPGNCICGYREFLADQILHRFPDRANLLIRRKSRET